MDGYMGTKAIVYNQNVIWFSLFCILVKEKYYLLCIYSVFIFAFHPVVWMYFK